MAQWAWILPAGVSGPWAPTVESRAQSSGASALRIVRSSLLNLVGLGAPLLLALFAIPVLVAGLGDARFGLLTLIWALVSYLGLFDLGLGRALTLRLASVLGRGEDEQVGPLCGSGLAMTAGVGLFAGLVLLVAAPWAPVLLSGLPDAAEAKTCLQLLALALPFAIVTSVLRGMLEARGSFGIVNVLRLLLGAWTFAGPVLVLELAGPDLVAIAAVLVLGRLLGTLAHAWAAWRVLPQMRGRLAWRADAGMDLLRSGGWLLLSNVLGPLMGLADRFIVGVFVPMAALAYYATPQEVVMKLWIVPGALSAVLFPALAAQIAAQQQVARLCRQSLLGLVVVLLPITLGLATFAHPLLSLWLGDRFAGEARVCAALFAAGMFVTGLAQLPYTLLQSTGRAATTALLHLIELPLFVAALAWAADRHGIEGVAWVWLARVVVDAVLLFIAAQQLPLGGRERLFDAAALGMLCAAPLSFAGLLLPGATLQAGAWLLASLVCLVAGGRAWRRRSEKMGDLASLS